MGLVGDALLGLILGVMLRAALEKNLLKCSAMAVGSVSSRLSCKIED